DVLDAEFFRGEERILPLGWQLVERLRRLHHGLSGDFGILLRALDTALECLEVLIDLRGSLSELLVDRALDSGARAHPAQFLPRLLQAGEGGVEVALVRVAAVRARVLVAGA